MVSFFNCQLFRSDPFGHISGAISVTVPMHKERATHLHSFLDCGLRVEESKDGFRLQSSCCRLLIEMKVFFEREYEGACVKMSADFDASLLFDDAQFWGLSLRFHTFAFDDLLNCILPQTRVCDL